MNRLVFSTIAIISFQLLSAQVDYPTQPPQGYYEKLKEIIMPIVPTEQQMVSAKTEKIPEGMKDTLLKYDWYEVANYYFFEKSYVTYWPKDINERETKYGNQEFKFKRYTPAGICYYMTLDRRKTGMVSVTTTTFDENTAEKLVEVKKVVSKDGASKSYVVTEIYGEKEKNQILSYKDGILIVEVKKTPTATTKKFHIAYKAIPKEF